MLIALVVTIIPTNQPASAAVTPKAVTGRILTPAESGDSVNWIEIAQSGKYSLIVRSNYLNWYDFSGYYGNVSWQTILFGTNTTYTTSNVYAKINAWFSGTNSKYGDNLGANARLRKFTVENNAKTVPGTASDTEGVTNGFSNPTDTKRATGKDIAFALSFSEVVNFVS